MVDDDSLPFVLVSVDCLCLGFEEEGNRRENQHSCKLVGEKGEVEKMQSCASPFVLLFSQ